MYVEAKIIENGEVINTFYDDASPEGLEKGAIIKEESQYSNGTKTYHEYKILSSKETINPNTTQFDPNKRKPMLQLELEEIPSKLN